MNRPKFEKRNIEFMNDANGPKKELSSFWNYPFGYEQNLLILISLWFVGIQLEYLTGGLEKNILQFPDNLYFLIIWHVSLLIINFKFPQILKTFLAKEFIFTFLGGWVFLIIISGIVPQDHGQKNLLNQFGLTHIVVSWPYLFTLVLLASSLFLTIIKRFARFSLRESVFLLNHTGLWIILVVATFGSGDQVSWKMNLYEGKATWEAYDKNSKIYPLPFAIYLSDFILQEYPPELALISASGKLLSKKKTSGMKQQRISLKNYEVFFDEVINDGVFFNNEWKRGKHPGNVWHAHIQVYDKKNQQLLGSGDIATGSFLQAEQIFLLDNNDHKMIIKYLSPRPQKFTSMVKVFTPSQTELKTSIEVNKPFGFDRYQIYQHSYDQKLGKWSQLSVLELVYDPWIKIVYGGVFFLLIGALGLAFFPKKWGG